MLATIDLNIAGQQRKFILPHTRNMLQIAEGILRQETYPRIDFLSDKIDRVFDIGANVGASAVFFCFAYANAQVYAYEPGSAAFKLLCRNTQDLERVTAINAALGSEAVDCILNLGGDGGETSSIVRNHLAPGVSCEPVTMRRASSEFARTTKDRETVLLKIDTEGCEVPILSDLAPHLGQVAAVHLEYHSESDRIQIEGIMREHQLTLFAASASHPHRGENLFVKQELLDSHTYYSNYVIPPIQPSGPAG